jgi:flagellar basal-body rod protein FlgF
MQIPDALSSAAAGMKTQGARLDTIAENLSNASTAGYRSRRSVLMRFGERLRTATVAAESQGPLRRTDVPTDLALLGPGYFAVAAPHGVEYTRDGRMTLDADGYLCDARGNKVLGSLGPVRMPRGALVHADGRIYANGRAIDRLRIVDLDGTHVKRAAASVRAGYLEDSGVDPIAEMTSLVATQRAYEADQKAAQRADDSLKLAVTDVPAVRP